MSEVKAISTEVLIGQETKTFFEKLEEVKTNLPTMPTQHIVDGLGMIKPYEKALEDFVKVARKELVDNRLDEIPEDIKEAKGHKYMNLSYGGRLKLEKRTSFDFDLQTAECLLTNIGVYDEALTETETIIDQNKFISLAKRMLEALVKVEHEDMGDFAQELNELLEVSSKLDEAKIDALTKLGKITPEQYASMYNEKPNYAMKFLKK